MNLGNFSNSLFTSNTANVIDIDDSKDQIMAGFPTLYEISSNPTLASELYDHITCLDEQLINLQNKTKEEVTFYRSHIASLE
ncbi:hypothetical protein TorRG33x02_253300 [Trema orientale]|uniref:Uncharacterized protein n=1 Tax=Trema orientale TaxID=63057 RepID=A0A2P5DF37_TREOI|nr:hypothetical protein TorRG33x02_253300 [Trema orientale]